ncbi:PilT protein domain protein [Thermodesulfatator indicus DSM 15286]|uniref:PilT protein domain protein n=1 Tax=Thermodesulfatator indicus (strain DSM 15286 / JCM 11887 / CIR29812) TaxID=667014 RepID=F8AC45_THEID|nr:type II toxin-antitoxin system VapC family toxin [Thermodesulfatator indicus]AEH44600.1 PilT protein domain protein [Thermodesulfatator indicus DSM 15286]
MITAVDTNILIDILEPDPVYGLLSKEALKRCLLEGIAVACEVVWAEVAVAYSHARDELVNTLKEIGIQFSPMSFEASLMAARCWSEYIKRSNKKRRIAADFLIGGHALVQCDRLLTRDKGFYRSYFKDLNVISP